MLQRRQKNDFNKEFIEVSHESLNFQTYSSSQQYIFRSRNDERLIMKRGKIAVAILALSIAGMPFAHSAEPTKLTAEQKAAFEAAKATYKTNIEAYRAAREAAKAQIASAKTTFESAKSAATTPEAKKAAHDTFAAAKKSALSSVPTKPTKPVRP